MRSCDTHKKKTELLDKNIIKNRVAKKRLNYELIDGVVDGLDWDLKLQLDLT